MNKIATLLCSVALATTMGVGLASPAAASTSPGLQEKRDNLLALHVAARKSKCGANSIKVLAGLQNAALYHAQDMADEGYTSHNSQNPYEFWGDRVARFTEHQPGGENIGSGQLTSDEIFAGWMASPDHKANIMNCSLKWVGFGFAVSGTGPRKWVADFAY